MWMSGAAGSGAGCTHANLFTTGTAAASEGAGSPTQDDDDDTPGVLSPDEEAHIRQLQRDVASAYQRGEYEAALDVATACMAAVEASALGTEHPVYASAVNNTGAAYKALGNLEEAASAYHKAAQVYRSTVGPDHLSTAAAVNNLGLALKSQAEQADGVDKISLLDQARTCLEQALQTRRKQLPDDSLLVASSSQHLASVLRLQGGTHNLATAEQMLRAAHSACSSRCQEGNLDPASARTARMAAATSANNLAVHLKATGGDHNQHEAYTLYKEALDTRLELLGAVHPDTVTTEYNLAELLRAMGREDEATEMQAAIVAKLSGTATGTPAGSAR